MNFSIIILYLAFFNAQILFCLGWEILGLEFALSFDINIKDVVT